jgi:hypothetical protein
MDDRPASHPLTIKTGRAISGAPVSPGSSLPTRFILPLRPRRFPFPPWQEAKAKPDRTKGNQK